MDTLSPSILAADFGNLAQQIKEAKDAGANYLHIDVMDGIYVPSISMGLPVISSIRKYSDAFFDVHLMIEDPGRYVADFAEAGADGITVHVEACPDVEDTLELIRKQGKKVGISLNPVTPISEIEPYLSLVDMVLVMTVNPGFGGQKLIPETVDKVRELKAILKEKNLDVDIEVDGGVTVDNVAELTKAGANVIVAGSAIFNGDITANCKAMLERM